MSFSFHVTCPAPQVDILRAFPVPFTLLEPAPATGAWPDGAVYWGYIPKVSTRCVETSWRNGRFEARVLALSCPEDYALAVALCRDVATDAGVWVETEEGQWFDPTDLEAYGSEWIAQHVHGVNQAVLEMALHQDEPMEVLGLAEPYLLQKDFAKELLDTDGPARQERLFADIREVVYGLGPAEVLEGSDAPSEPPAAAAGPETQSDAGSEAVPAEASVAPKPPAKSPVGIAKPLKTSGMSSTWIAAGVAGVAAVMGIGWMLIR